MNPLKRNPQNSRSTSRKDSFSQKFNEFNRWFGYALWGRLLNRLLNFAAFAMRYWLMKSEPDVYGITDLKRDRTTIWDGVRNYQARNYLRSMQPGDLAFFYHSNATPPGIAGLMKIAESSIPDPTQFDASSKYYDAKSTIEAPRWQTVRVEFVAEAEHFVTLEELRKTFPPDELLVVRQGNRLSVMPIPEALAQKILKLIQKI